MPRPEPDEPTLPSARSQPAAQPRSRPQPPAQRPALTFLNEMTRYQGETQGRSPFLGIDVFYNRGNSRSYLKTYLNTELGLTIGSKLNDLKYAILSNSKELQVNCPLDLRASFAINNFKNTIFNSNDEYMIDIKKIYFGTPSGDSNMPYEISTSNGIRFRSGYEDLNNNEYNNETLSNMYYFYMDKADNLLREPQLSTSSLKDVFYNYLESTNDEVNFPGLNLGKCFYNINNPIIPQEYRPQLGNVGNERILKKSTRHPLAWIIVEVECRKNYNDTQSSISTIRGGRKTRQNKSRQKQNKSRKRNRL